MSREEDELEDVNLSSNDDDMGFGQNDTSGSEMEVPSAGKPLRRRTPQAPRLHSPPWVRPASSRPSASPVPLPRTFRAP